MRLSASKRLKMQRNQAHHADRTRGVVQPKCDTSVRKESFSSAVDVGLQDGSVSHGVGVHKIIESSQSFGIFEFVRQGTLRMSVQPVAQINQRLVPPCVAKVSTAKMLATKG
jgi:hypothetical protein